MVGLVVGGEDPEAARLREGDPRTRAGGRGQAGASCSPASKRRARDHAVSDCVLSLSSTRNRSGRTVLEPLAMGRPVVGMRTGVAEILGAVSRMGRWRRGMPRRPRRGPRTWSPGEHRWWSSTRAFCSNACRRRRCRYTPASIHSTALMMISLPANGARLPAASLMATLLLTIFMFSIPAKWATVPDWRWLDRAGAPAVRAVLLVQPAN